MNFTTLAFNPLSRMDEVYRYSSVYQNKTESLSEHVVDVCMMSYLISKYLNCKYCEGISIENVLEKGLLHDIDEVITGDVPRNTKYATKEVKEDLNTVAERSVSLIEEFVGIPLFNIWDSAKSGKEGLIVKVVDMLCVAKKCINEIELHHNLVFLKVISELETHLSDMMNHSRLNELDAQESVDYIRGLISQAKDEVTAIRVKYQNVINKYHIKENIIEREDI